MLKIGDFSKLANVTVKALRHYDELGLLKPAWIDRYTSYRYYALDQLPRLNRILALKDLGLSLEQVQRILNNDLSAEELRGMLHLKQAELRQQLVVEQMRLARVAARLRQIEQEGAQGAASAARDGVVLRPVEPLLVAYTHLVVPCLEQLAERRAAAQKGVEDWLARQNITPPGPWLMIYTHSEFLEQNIPLEVAVGLAELPRGPLPANGQVLVRRLSRLDEAIIYTHIGALEDLPGVYTTLYHWAERNGYRVCGPAREVHWTDAGVSAPEEWELTPTRTKTVNIAAEVQLPVEAYLFYNQSKEFKMEPKIIEHDPFLVAGTIYEGANQNQEIPAMWQNEFLPRIHEIKRLDNYVSYGICEMDPDLPEGEFRYMAGVEVTQPEDAPTDMRTMMVPGGKYAVFQHTGAMETLSKTYEYIYQSWLPQSGYKRSTRPDLEVYGQEFHGFKPDSVLYLWVPIE